MENNLKYIGYIVEHGLSKWDNKQPRLKSATEKNRGQNCSLLDLCLGEQLDRAACGRLLFLVSHMSLSPHTHQCSMYYCRSSKWEPWCPKFVSTKHPLTLITIY